MALSLGLLLVFLVLFLKKVYTDELATLQRESSLLFVNAVRGIEGEMFDKIILHDVQNNGDSVRVRVSSNLMEEKEIESTLRLPKTKPGDSVQILMYRQERSPTRIRRDAQWRVQLPEGASMTNRPDMQGSLSMIVAMSDKRFSEDSLGPPPLDTAQIFALLQRDFGQAIQNASLPVNFHLIRTKIDSTNAPMKGFVAGSYTDLASGEQYEASLSDYKTYLFRKIVPQLLFAILLFVCVTLAFLFIFQTMRQQQRLAEQKNDFIRNITHELKTPIATVSVAVEALQNFDALHDPARTREYLDISRLELSRLSLLVDKVLRMSLFEKGAPELTLEPLNLKSLVEDILGSMKLQFEQSGAQVGFQTTGSDFSYRGDRLHLTSVVYNLLDNALKYSPIRPDIAIGLAQDAGQLTLQVRDRGIGIPAAYRDKIFEKFFRVPAGDVHNVKGHGLGLSYVAGVVSQHGGRIEVDSEVGAGACFTVILPN